MKPADGQKAKRERLAAYLDGEVTPSEAAAIESELAQLVDARQRLESLRRIRDALGSPIPELENLDLVPALRRAIVAPPPTRVWRANPRLWYGASAVAAAVVLVLGGLMFVNQRIERLRVAAVDSASIRHAVPQSYLGFPEFRAKSGASTASRQDQWAGIRIYRVDKSNQPRPLMTRLAAADGLVFSYNNLGGSPFDYLMIFAVDARGEVRWYHPAYEQEGTNPQSIALKKGAAEVRLPEVVYHDYAPGPLVIHALFTSRPLSVSDVEGHLRDGKLEVTALPAVGASDQVQLTSVEP